MTADAGFVRCWADDSTLHSIRLMQASSKTPASSNPPDRILRRSSEMAIRMPTTCCITSWVRNSTHRAHRNQWDFSTDPRKKSQVDHLGQRVLSLSVGFPDYMYGVIPQAVPSQAVDPHMVAPSH